MAQDEWREVLLLVDTPKGPRSLRTRLSAAATLAEVECEAVSMASAVGGGVADVIPLEYYDALFSEWCVLTTSVLPGLPATATLRCGGSAACASSGWMGSSPGGLRLGELQSLGRRQSLEEPQALRGLPDGRRRSDAGQHRSLLAALAAEDLTALPLAAIWLEERLKTVSLATVCVVALGFLAWYLQSALQMLLIAALLAVLLEPLVDRLSAPPCGGMPSLALPRPLAIAITLALVLALFLLLLLLLYNAVDSFMRRAPEFGDASQHALEVFKLRWKASRLGPYFDIDILAKALATSIKDASMMSAALAGTFSFVGGLLFRGLAIMVLWIFLVMSPSSAAPPAADPPRQQSQAADAAAREKGPPLGLRRSMLAGQAPLRHPSAPDGAAGAADVPHPRGMAPSRGSGGSTGGGASRPSAEQQTRTYLRWKAAISLGKAVACALVYLACGVPLWPLFGVVTFWLNWLPLVGSGIAVLLPVPLALVDPSVSWLAFGLFLGLTTAVHLLVDNLVDQVVMARAMTLHPVALIVGLSAAQIVWGVVGMVLSVPLLAVLKSKLASTAHPYAQACAALLEGEWQIAAAITEGSEGNAGDARGGKDKPMAKSAARFSALRRLLAALGCDWCSRAPAGGERRELLPAAEVDATSRAGEWRGESP